MRDRLPKLVGLALTVVFLALALQRVDLPGFVDELSRVNYIWLVPSALRSDRLRGKRLTTAMLLGIPLVLGRGKASRTER